MKITLCIPNMHSVVEYGWNARAVVEASTNRPKAPVNHLFAEHLRKRKEIEEDHVYESESKEMCIKKQKMDVNWVPTPPSMKELGALFLTCVYLSKGLIKSPNL